MIYEGSLGMNPPADDNHIRKYSLTEDTAPTEPTPLVLGINWYSAFDNPKPFATSGSSKSTYWIGRSEAGHWGSIRGGHAICVKPPSISDSKKWWAFYEQGKEGACVGYSVSRQGTLCNRKRYDGLSLYKRAKQVDDWPGEDYDGTSVRAGYDVARTEGLWTVRAGDISGPRLADGVMTNRWATSIEDMAYCLDPITEGLSVLNAGYIELLNSWGIHYPWKVRMELEAAERLIFREGGECAVITDR